MKHQGMNFLTLIFIVNNKLYCLFLKFRNKQYSRNGKIASDPEYSIMNAGLMQILQFPPKNSFPHRARRSGSCGNSDVMQMFFRAQKSITTRSSPTRAPPCGTAPHLSSSKRNTFSLSYNSHTTQFLTHNRTEQGQLS
jgi:hypothetical protein